MNIRRALGLIGVGLVFILLGATLGTSHFDESRFRSYSLPRTFGYFSAAFSPNDHDLSVIAGTNFAEKEIQLWDFRSAKLISRRALPLESSLTGNHSQFAGIYGYTESGSEVLFYSSGYLKLLDGTTFDPHEQIDLDASSWPVPQSGSKKYSFVKAVQMDKRGERVAVLLQWGAGGGGELRVYSLISGELIRKWNYEELRGKKDRTEDFGGADISSDGKVVAVSIIPFNLGEDNLSGSDRNVFVLDVDSGRTLTSINTGYPAGEIRFAPTDSASLLTVSADNYDRSHSDKDGIKVWSLGTGKLLRELGRPPEGVHFQVQVSSEGDIVLGYTGLEKFMGHWWLGQEENGTIAYDRFTLWNLETGQIIASSPQITPVQSPRRFLLSPKGDVVLMYPETAWGAPLTFYELLAHG